MLDDDERRLRAVPIAVGAAFGGMVGGTAVREPVEVQILQGNRVYRARLAFTGIPLGVRILHRRGLSPSLTAAAEVAECVRVGDTFYVPETTANGGKRVMVSLSEDLSQLADKRVQ